MHAEAKHAVIESHVRNMKEFTSIGKARRQLMNKAFGEDDWPCHVLLMEGKFAFERQYQGLSSVRQFGRRGNQSEEPRPGWPSGSEQCPFPSAFRIGLQSTASQESPKPRPVSAPWRTFTGQLRYGIPKDQSDYHSYHV